MLFILEVLTVMSSSRTMDSRVLRLSDGQFTFLYQLTATLTLITSLLEHLELNRSKTKKSNFDKLIKTGRQF